MENTEFNTVELSNCSREKKYLCEYRFQNSTWAIVITAHSQDEAEQKLREAGKGKVLGEIEAVVPGNLGWVAKGLTWLRNFFA